MVDVYMLDLIGTFVFAVSGANVGIQRKLNVLGVSVFAFLTAVGGGTVRCVLTHTTPFYFIDHHYIEVIIIGIVFALLTYPFFQYLHFPLLLIDALGVVTFAYIGAYKAESTHLGSFAVVLFAGLTAVGGGMLRDIVTGKIPEVFLKSSYAFPSILLGLTYCMLQKYMNQTLVVYSVLLFFFFVHCTASTYDITLWIPFHGNEEQSNRQAQSRLRDWFIRNGRAKHGEKEKGRLPEAFYEPIGQQFIPQASFQSTASLDEPHGGAILPRRKVQKFRLHRF